MVSDRPWLSRTAISTMASALLFGLGACTAPAPPGGPSVAVTIHDFRIIASASDIAAGAVAFDVHDQGPSTHEFVVVRTDLPPDRLPLRPDGLTVDEDSALLRSMGEIDDLDLGDSKRLVLHLGPGRYVLFCNLEGHYLGGMHASIQVGAGGKGTNGSAA